MNDFNRTPATSAPLPNNTSRTAGDARDWPAFNEIDLDARMWRDLDPIEQALRMERNDYAWWAHYRLAKAQQTREGVQ